MQIDEEIMRFQKLLSLPAKEFINARLQTPEIFETLTGSKNKSREQPLKSYNRPFCNISNPPKFRSQESVKDACVLSQRTTSSSIKTRMSHSGSFPRTTSSYDQISTSDLSQSNFSKSPVPPKPSSFRRNDNEFEDMMSEMGPPGMLTFIFSNNETNEECTSRPGESGKEKDFIDIETVI